MNNEDVTHYNARLGEPTSGVGLRQMVRPILVFATPLRCEYGGEGERCLLQAGHDGDHWLDVRMDR